MMSDDMEWPQHCCYGHSILKSPNLVEMPSNGLGRNRLNPAAPGCSPTRASIIAGRINERVGVLQVGDSINNQERMLSTEFQKAG